MNTAGWDPSRAVLLAAVGLHLVTETALTPFYPALFRTVYGVTDLSATGAFVVACRVAALCALPLWGLAARRWRLERLVIAGQASAVSLTAALTLAPSYRVFVTLGVTLVAAKAVVLLAYPVIARRHRDGLLPAVREYVIVFHAATVAAALLGAVVVGAPDPRAALPLLAVVEALLLLLCVVVLRSSATATPGAACTASVPRGGRWHLTIVAGYLLATTAAMAVVRPFFIEYATAGGAGNPTAAGGAGTLTGALLFLAPSVAALAVLPWAMTLRAAGGPWVLPVSFGVAAAGLAAQAASTDPLGLAATRLLFGAGLGLGQFALDERVLTATGTAGSTYSTAAAAQNAGLLVAPVLATVAADRSLAGPLLVGAVLFVGLAAGARLTLPPPPSALTEVTRVDASTLR